MSKIYNLMILIITFYIIIIEDILNNVFDLNHYKY
jgi:hypothetical protein